jgi:hypothetical protein
MYESNLIIKTQLKQKNIQNKEYLPNNFGRI